MRVLGERKRKHSSLQRSAHLKRKKMRRFTAGFYAEVNGEMLENAAPGRSVHFY